MVTCYETSGYLDDEVAYTTTGPLGSHEHDKDTRRKNMSVPSASPRALPYREPRTRKESDPTAVYQHQLCALVRGAWLAHRLDLAERTERETQIGSTFKPELVVQMTTSDKTSILKDTSRVKLVAANDISAAEGSHWRRKHEFG